MEGRMMYSSTRGGDRNRTFEDVLMSSYASDRGLYVPENLPQLTTSTLAEWSSFNLPDICSRVVHLFSGIPVEDIQVMATSAFAEFNKGNKDAVPLRKVGDMFHLDTSLGPTMAFKDIGQQMIAQLMNYYLKKRNGRINIIVETSGDTGPAAIAAVQKCSLIDIFCLYPSGRVSNMQELQMITMIHDNVHVFRTEGDCDENCSVLKELFCDDDFTKEYNCCSVNSINWARIAVQSSYYIWAYLQIFNGDKIGHLIDFCIPTGAFGNAMAGYIAKMMGLPIGKIVCATNANDIVFRTIKLGDMNMGTNVPTNSPAMDIQFPYNLERMLYFMCEKDGAVVSRIMSEFQGETGMAVGTGDSRLDPLLVTKIQETFDSLVVSDAQTLETIQSLYQTHEVLLCPHSAVGAYAAQTLQEGGVLDTPVPDADHTPIVCVLTAHPAKFEDSVGEALGGESALSAAKAAFATDTTTCSAFSSGFQQADLLKMKPQQYEWLRKASTPTSTGSTAQVIDPDWRNYWIKTLKTSIITVACSHKQ